MSTLGNPIKATSRTFDTILADINTDAELIDKPNWFKRLIAGVGDVISTWLDAAYNGVFLRTAYTWKQVSDLCSLIDYQLAAQTTSSGVVLFHTDTSGTYPFTAASTDLVARSSGSFSTTSKKFEAIAGFTFTNVNSNFTTNYAVNSQLTVSTDFQYTGHKCRVTSSGTLPAPLIAGTNYYLIYVSATKVLLATTIANAVAGNAITLTSNGTGTHNVRIYSGAVTVYQQDTISIPQLVGTSNGTAWQQFTLPDTLILPATIVVVIASVTWTAVTTFVNSISTDTVFKIIQLSNNGMAIQFGDGTYGAIPASSADITVSYSTGGGAASNVSGPNNINAYAGSDSRIQAVTNGVNVLTGGSDAESISSAKMLAPMLLKTRDNFFSVADGIALVLKNTDISQVQINRNTYGPLSCQVIAVATGGGNPSGARRTAIQNQLIALSPLADIDVHFDVATITSIAVTSGVHLKAGYLWANVQPYVRLAWKLLFSETGNEIYNVFVDSGIADAVTRINLLFTETFAAIDYSTIQPLLENMTPRQFGDSIYLSDADAYVQAFVPGIDYMTVSLPSFPVTTATNEITTYGAITLSSI